MGNVRRSQGGIFARSGFHLRTPEKDYAKVCLRENLAARTQMHIHTHTRIMIHRTKLHASMVDRTNPHISMLGRRPFSVLQFPRWNILYKEMRA